MTRTRNDGEMVAVFSHRVLKALCALVIR
jgi:hypothetical protein